MAKTAVSTTRQQQIDFLKAYGKQAARQSSIIGKFLKFNKGEYVAGADDEVIPIGTRMIVNTDSALVGWTLWLNKKNVEQDMGQINQGYQAKQRSELSMVDESEWPVDERTGKPRDPWQHGNVCLFKALKGGDMYTFTTTSVGGKGALGKLIEQASDHMAEGNEQYPIVALNIDSYKHAEYGKIYIPVFEIVDWYDISDFTVEEATPKAVKKVVPKKTNNKTRSLTYK